VRRILLKPGHFVSSLRRYQYAAEGGQIPDADLAAAEEALELPDGDLTEHETAEQLHQWLRAALEYAAWARARHVASPARATRSPQMSSHKSSEHNASSKGGYPVNQPLPIPAAYPAELPTAESVGLPDVELPQAVKNFSPALGATRSPSPKTLLRRPPGAAAAPTPVAPVMPRASRAGFGVNWASMANGEPKTSSSSTASRTHRRSVSGQSPRGRASPSPSPTKLSPKAVSGQSSGNSPKAPVPGGPARTRGTPSPAPTKRPTFGKSDAVRSPSAGSHAVRVPRQSVPSTRRSTSSVVTSELARPASGSLAQNAAPLPSPEDFASMRRRLDQEKKEVKQIRGLQSQLKWGMEREEKRQTEEERREEARKIMEWRESQATGMREYVEEKSREQRIQELLESKDFQEFKREWKQALRTEEIERIRQQLEEDMDNAHWQVELQKAIVLDRQMTLQERQEAADELRELREREKQKEKAQQQEDRAHDIALDFAHQASQISAEKEELMRNLQLLRAQSRQKAPTGGGAGFWH